MKLFKYILFSLLLIVSGVGYGQNAITPAPLGRFALFFDGVDEYLNIDNSLNVLSTTTKGSFCLWIKPFNAIGAGQNTILSFGDKDAATDIGILNTNGGLIGFNTLIGGTMKWRVLTDNVVLVDNTWVHVCGVQDGISALIYIDAVAVDQSFDSNIDKTVWFNNALGIDNGRISSLNRSGGGNFGHWNGDINQASLWNTNLSLSEIQEIYNNNKPTNLKTHSKYANLVAWYQMGEFSSYDGTNWNIIDASVNDNPGVSVNMEESDRVVSTLIYEQPVGILRVGNNLITSP